MKYDRCSNDQCGGIILADTEDWKKPLCHECWLAIGSPDFEPEEKTYGMREDEA